MWCFSCFKNGPSQDDLQIEKAIQNSLADEQARITRQRRLADEEFARALQDSLNLEEEEERQRTKDLENDAEMARVVQQEEDTKERERQLNKSALDEEDKQIARIIEESLKEKGKRKQFEDQMEEDTKERERQLNKSALDEEDKQIARIIEESLKEKGKRKQFEDQMEEDKQFAMVVQESLNKEESPPRLEENRNISLIALLDEDEQLDDKVLWESLKEKGQIKHSKDQVEEDEQFPDAGHVLNPTLSMCEGCNSEIEHGRSLNLLDAVQHEEETKERERQLNKSAMDEEDKQLARIIEESLKEKGVRKQFEDQVKEDKQFAMTVQESLNMEESPPRLEENRNVSPIALLDEDEQLDDKVLWESLKEKGQIKHSKDQVEEDEQFPDAGYILNPTLSMCEGCNSEIEHGRSVNLLDAVWHPECFCCLACHKPIAMHEFSNSRGRFHRPCYKEHRHPNCYVCTEKIPSTAKGIKYNEHPFWKDKYCPSHDVDGTAKCCSCEKLEPLGTNYVMLDDERRLCLECMECAVMDTDECHSLHIEIREFFEGLNMKIEKEFSVFLVEKQALNKAEEKEKIDHHRAVVTRGLCLAEEQIVRIVSKRPSRRGPNNRLIGMATENQRLFRKCEVIAILIIYGLPRLLTGSILAHEMMHAWLRLNGYRNLRPELEEGLCQVLGHMWLESQTYAATDAATAIASSSSAASSSYAPPVAATTLKKGDPSDFERRFVEFCKNQIETDDSPIYGLGFKKVNQMVTNYSLQETLREIKLGGSK